jgi:hypothetical protein
MGKEEDIMIQLERTIRKQGDTDFGVDSKPLEQGTTQDASERLVASREAAALEEFDKPEKMVEDKLTSNDPKVREALAQFRALKNEEMIETRQTFEVEYDGNLYKVTAPIDKTLLDTTKFRPALELDAQAPKGMVLKVYSIQGNNLVYLDGNIEVKDKDLNTSGHA